MLSERKNIVADVSDLRKQAYFKNKLVNLENDRKELIIEYQRIMNNFSNQLPGFSAEECSQFLLELTEEAQSIDQASKNTRLKLEKMSPSQQSLPSVHATPFATVEENNAHHKFGLACRIKNQARLIMQVQEELSDPLISNIDHSTLCQQLKQFVFEININIKKYNEIIIPSHFYSQLVGPIELPLVDERISSPQHCQSTTSFLLKTSPVSSSFSPPLTIPTSDKPSAGLSIFKQPAVQHSQKKVVEQEVTLRSIGLNFD